MKIHHEQVATWLQVGKHQCLLLDHLATTAELVSDWKWLWLSVSSQDSCVLVLNSWNREMICLECRVLYCR